MPESLPDTMRAVALDRYGGPDELQLTDLPLPRPGPQQVLIRLDSAGIGVWDPEVRSGSFKLGEPHFPLVIGNDGAGTVAAVGAAVERLREGDRVYAYTMEGGFYAEYVVVDQDAAAPIPPALDGDEAGALGADGITALRGLEDQLGVQAGQKLLIFGASGGIGHLAVQLARRIGAEVFAVASGADGVDLVRRLGADEAIDGRHDAIGEAVRSFAPDGFDAALILVNGRGLGAALAKLKTGARIAYPNGVEPAPEAPEGVESRAYDGVPDAEAFRRLNQRIGSEPFHVELGRVYSLEDAPRAHRELEEHHLGKLAFRLRAA
jgi:NADPH2:quinone reductase